MTTNAVSDAKSIILQFIENKHDSSTPKDLENLSTLLDTILPLSHFVCRVCLQHTENMALFFYSLAVSRVANIIICTAYNWLYENHTVKYGMPEHQQNLQIMAMGKLGGSELNFSSDIDLIFAYPSAGETSGTRRTVEHHKFFTLLAQKLIYALNHVNEHGQCYRVDMRLRPMGESGPIVMSYAALETYYQDVGRAWERFALQKMRIINHNSDSDDLYALVKPFVYRKYVDFTTIDSIREMKRMIEKEVLRRQLSHNIKLGRGGIREVEFFIQALQLIHAGRNPDKLFTSTSHT